MKSRVLAFACAIISINVVLSQELPRKLHNLEVLDLKGEAARLPEWGKKNLMIFYVDPDRAAQNIDFTYFLEESKRAKSSNIHGFGVINMKDAPFIPSSLAHAIANKRTETNGATILTDPTRTLSQEWELGDCNNQFVLLLVNKECELVYLRKGIFSQQDQDDFFEIIDGWR